MTNQRWRLLKKLFVIAVLLVAVRLVAFDVGTTRAKADGVCCSTCYDNCNEMFNICFEPCMHGQPCNFQTCISRFETCQQHCDSTCDSGC
jgi:hypothetical protein